MIEAGEEIEAEQEDGFLEAGQRKVKKVQDPRLPSEEDVTDHYVSGLMPYRSWCHGGRMIGSRVESLSITLTTVSLEMSLTNG